MRADTNYRTVRIPFENDKQAHVARETLNPDPELRAQELRKTLTVEDSQLVARFEASTDRNLRVAVNSFMDNVNLVVECIDELSPEKL